jgi:intracellular sulfur oxidation DsrE/DsrF family protein
VAFFNSPGNQALNGWKRGPKLPGRRASVQAPGSGVTAACTFIYSNIPILWTSNLANLGRVPMSEIDRRNLLVGLAAGGAAVATSAHAAPNEINFKDMKKETEVACLYHCDFGDDKRYSAMLRNINNHLSVYNFDPLGTKIVIVAHSSGIKYHLKTLAGTPWEKGPPINPELHKRMDALGQYGVEVYLCKITFQRQKLDTALTKDESYIKLVPSGVATVAALQSKGFSYLKVG